MTAVRVLESMKVTVGDATASNLTVVAARNPTPRIVTVFPATLNGENAGDREKTSSVAAPAPAIPAPSASATANRPLDTRTRIRVDMMTPPSELKDTKPPRRPPQGRARIQNLYPLVCKSMALKGLDPLPGTPLFIRGSPGSVKEKMPFSEPSGGASGSPEG